MKMFSFLFLSLALHAVALAYPALFPELKVVNPLVVTVLDADGGNGNGPTGDESSAKKKTARLARKATPEKRLEQTTAEPERKVELPKSVSTPDILPDVKGEIPISIGQYDSAGAVENSSGSSGSKGSGSGTGGDGSGLGLAGDGHGGGGLGVTSTYAGVSYAHTPKPAYPEQARKAGWEGTVILGVLVNVGGKAERIEIQGSSGHEALDQAAVEGLKRWLFRPARHGARAVESWVKIPVVFRLAEVKD